MRSVEREYKSVNVKAAVNLYKNPDLTMETVRKFEERSVHGIGPSIVSERCCKIC